MQLICSIYQIFLFQIVIDVHDFPKFLVGHSWHNTWLISFAQNIWYVWKSTIAIYKKND